MYSLDITEQYSPIRGGEKPVTTAITFYNPRQFLIRDLQVNIEPQNDSRV